MFPIQRYGLSDSVDRVVSGHGEHMTCLFSGNSTSGRPFSILVPYRDANRWANGELIQNCFPYLSADEREILMTGIDGQTWNEMFAVSEEEEEEV